MSPQPRGHDQGPGPSKHPERVDEVEEASIESFPASDPPSFTPVTGAGAPDDEEGAEEASSSGH